ncbi:acyltransferase [Polymorphobacter multimanifer]|uniref:Peptidoglycan/LPS O-acetylase OafA/YrhL n=1 Tax=Polymorphobacter multimanifer TaxID=1070431 RepID=A0A841L397_9SPHN|nr:acyltransferase [Polymorphobacter multimanifer]MBB6226890.1 peptidoglycan/LPS O-acetylase OafA/YrhL [Polymorphobacter multimanifer]GGI87595.1 acyltransferase [Polymorphobacter multimanifer]
MHEPAVQPESSQAPSTHYHLIDLLRGLAALAILFWHYQHFSLTGPTDVVSPAELARQPLAGVFGPLYVHGHLAVQFFWLISGFVFATVYAHRDTSTRAFALARFARLYPLHLITLLVVTGLQAVSVDTTGQFQIYGNNDLRHFLLNLGFVSAWGLERGYSFNAPIWSVSIELLVYALFWAIRRPLFRLGLLGPAVLTAVFLLGVTLKAGGPFWACGLFFFAGCTVSVFHTSHPGWKQPAVAVLAAVVALMLAQRLPAQAIAAAMAASLILAAWAEQFVNRGTHSFPRGLGWIGDNTYSLYLWHIPVQIVLLLAISDKAVFATPAFLIAWLVGMMALSRASFLFIESPLRRRITARWSASG